MPSIIINNKTKRFYLDRLIGKIYKILPLREESGLTPKIYLGGLLVDINSANNLFDGVLVELIVKLNSIYKNNLSHGELRRIVLECTNICKILKEEFV